MNSVKFDDENLEHKEKLVQCISSLHLRHENHSILRSFNLTRLPNEVENCHNFL